MKQKHLPGILVLFLIEVIGCQNQPVTVSATPQSVGIEQASVTLSPVRSNMPEPTATLAPTSIATAVKTPVLEEVCSSEEISAADFSPDATILLEEENAARFHRYFLHDSKMEDLILEDDRAFDIEVPPSGNFILYSVNTDENNILVKVYDLIGGTTLTIDPGDFLPVEEYTFSRVNLTGENLAFWYSFYQDDVKYNRPLVFYDLENNTSTHLNKFLTYPNIRFDVVWISPNGRFANFVTKSYEEDMKWILYDAYDDSFSELFTASRELGAAWSLDSSKLLIFADEFKIVDIQSLSYEVVDIPGLENESLSVNRSTWSNDGSEFVFIQYYADLTEHVSNGLYKYNLNTATFTHYCIEADISTLYGELQWSPDGNFLGWADSDDEFMGVIFDPYNGHQFEINDLAFIGWLGE